MNDFLRRYVMHNLGLKLISLLLAAGLWLALAHAPVAEVAVEAPIVFRNVPDNLGISYESIPKAQIVLRGPEHAVGTLRPSDVHAEIDLSGATPGEHTFPASSVHIHQPYELQVRSIAPDKFHITLVGVLKPSPVAGGHP
ncbi:MAG TPA: CdaR family protein [Terriglobales bacterium]|jgi:hypothetical protein